MSSTRGVPSTPLWHAVGASVRGVSHHKSGVPCQDAYKYIHVGTDVLVIAVADGAGSAARSDEGARQVVTDATAYLAAMLAIAPLDEAIGWDDLLCDSFFIAREMLSAYAYAQQAPLSDFATTLTVAILTNRWSAIAQVGDGLVIAQAEDETLFLAIPPQRGEYANSTRFLTSDDAMRHVAVHVQQEPVQAIAVATDGLTRLSLRLPQHTPHPPFWLPLLAFCSQADPATAGEELATFLASERVCKRTDDDKTVVLATRSGMFPVGGANTRSVSAVADGELDGRL